MSGRQFLIPLYYVRKQARLNLNEKKLITLLFITTLLTLIVIFKQLPTNLNTNELNQILIPKINNTIIHNDKDHVHKFKHIENEQNSNFKKDIDKKTLERKEKVKNMTLLAWNGYKKFAWGKNELKPISQTGHLAGVFGTGDNLGATIVDALDTLYIMDLHDEVKLGTKWIKENFNIKINAELSAFEINIRFLGGFLALYTLTQDKLFLEKSIEVADALLPAFSSQTGLPYSLFNPLTKTVRNYNWAAGSCSILAEIGTMSLEFQYLSDLTGNKVYEEKIDKIFKALEKSKNENGLYYNYINPNSGSWCGNQATIGGLADSFYEYLLKLWLYKNKSDKNLLNMYLKSIDSLRSKVYEKSQSKLGFFGEYSGSFSIKRMGHLACFSGGMFALTATHVDELDDNTRKMYEELAKDITNTCHESYIRTATHLGPESFSFDNGREVDPVDRYYILRPEVIESYFYLWRMTKDEKYREWAWDAVESLEKYCKTDNGYSGIRDVTSTNPAKDDVQQSFFFAETLKYLYLIFSDDDLLPLDKFVFNTEAHPFRIRNQN